MLRNLLPLPLLLGAVTPALATEWMVCGGGGANIGLLLGSFDALSISAVTIDIGDSHWATSETYGVGTGIAVGQAFADTETVRVDILDDTSSNRVAELRIFKTGYDGELVYGGILNVAGQGAWVVSCEGM